MKLVSFDYHCGGTWLYAALDSQKAGTAPAAILLLLNQVDRVIMTDAEAEAVLTWAAQLDDWTPTRWVKNHPHPLRIVTLTEAEVKYYLTTESERKFFVTDAARLEGGMLLPETLGGPRNGDPA